jgi:hypothetical protein
MHRRPIFCPTNPMRHYLLSVRHHPVYRRFQKPSSINHPAERNRKWLYSLLGEANSAIRLAFLRRPHAYGLVRDTRGMRLWQLEPGAERDRLTTEYAKAMIDSQFILCPAGDGERRCRHKPIDQHADYMIVRSFLAYKHWMMESIRNCHGPIMQHRCPAR